MEDEVEDDVKLASCGWNPTFYRRRDLPETENMPWIESLEMILVENPNQSDTCLKGTSVIETRAHPDEESVEVQTEDESIIRMFLRGTDDSDVCLPEVDRIEDFCDAINLYSLRPEKWIGPESLSRAAWLDERGSEAGEELSRPHGRWLTAHELFHELKKPRFRAVEPCVTAGGIDANRPSDGTASTSSASSIAHLDGSLPDSQTRTPEEDVQPEAERRLIFVNDPDPWSMCALIGTATYHQAPALRSALYKHLASETSIEVMCSSYGWPNFQLAFHLPYSAWRESEEACEDHRFDKNGEPLRQYKDVSVLDWNRTGSRAFVYEGQVSCVVTGIDEWRWVAYCLTDSFFDEEAGETEPQYGIDVSSGVHANPFAYGATDAEIPMKRPREFFLKILEIRVNQVKREWQRVARKVHQSIRKYERTHHYLLSPSLGRSSRRKVEDHDAKVRKSLYWVMQVTSLASQLSEDLAKTVEACDMFLDDYAIYFQGMYEADYGNSSLSAIRKSVHELRSLKRNLESITKRCDNFEQEVSCPSSFIDHGFNHVQGRAADTDKRL